MNCCERSQIWLDPGRRARVVVHAHPDQPWTRRPARLLRPLRI